jgi:hypothetical protein
VRRGPELDFGRCSVKRRACSEKPGKDKPSSRVPATPAALASTIDGDDYDVATSGELEIGCDPAPTMKPPPCSQTSTGRRRSSTAGVHTLSVKQSSSVLSTDAGCRS